MVCSALTDTTTEQVVFLATDRPLTATLAAAPVVNATLPVFPQLPGETLTTLTGSMMAPPAPAVGNTSSKSTPVRSTPVDGLLTVSVRLTLLPPNTAVPEAKLLAQVGGETALMVKLWLPPVKLVSPPASATAPAGNE